MIRLLSDTIHLYTIGPRSPSRKYLHVYYIQQQTLVDADTMFVGLYMYLPYESFCCLSESQFFTVESR
jgi:hypothetical protein